MLRSKSLALLGSVFALFVAMSVFAAPAAAQEMAEGTWGGTIEPPGGGVMDISFEVETGEALSITLVAPGMGELVADDEELVDGVLHFGFDAGGAYVVCELPKTDDGGFEGECVGDDGAVGYLTMTPPEN